MLTPALGSPLHAISLSGKEAACVWSLGVLPLWAMLCQQPPRHGACQLSRQTVLPPANRTGTGLLHLPGSPVDFTKELEKVSHKQGVSRLAMPPGRHCTWSISRCQDSSISSCSAVGEAETRGHTGISVLCPCPQQRQHEGGKSGCHLLPEQWHSAHSGSHGGCRQAWSRGQGKDQEQPGTNLSKMSCSACWGQGEKESSQLKSPQIKSQTQAGAQQICDPGNTVLLPNPEKPLLSPVLALGSRGSVQHPFPSAAALSTP